MHFVIWQVVAATESTGAQWGTEHPTLPPITHPPPFYPPPYFPALSFSQATFHIVKLPYPLIVTDTGFIFGDY